MFLFQDFRVMQISLNAAPTPCKPSETFFWIKLGLKNKNIHLRYFKDTFLQYGF